MPAICDIASLILFQDFCFVQQENEFDDPEDVDPGSREASFENLVILNEVRLDSTAV